jgi:hypothetical protein
MPGTTLAGVDTQVGLAARNVSLMYKWFFCSDSRWCAYGAIYMARWFVVLTVFIQFLCNNQNLRDGIITHDSHSEIANSITRPTLMLKTAFETK